MAVLKKKGDEYYVCHKGVSRKGSTKKGRTPGEYRDWWLVKNHSNIDAGVLPIAGIYINKKLFKELKGKHVKVKVIIED